MGETPQKGVLVAGLMSKPKYIPTWYNYDKTGSELQHQCTTKNAGKNYFTRCQMSILHAHIQDIIPRLPNELILVDIGSGNCSKSKICIDELIERQGKCSFYPVDISKEFLLQSVSKLSNEYGAAVNITPIPKDFEQGIEQLRSVEGPKLVLFLSTLMIMSYDDQVNILRKISTILTDECRLVFSADITQDGKTILMAYRTAIAQTFLRNAIVRLNKEEGSEIDMDMLDLVVDFTLDTKPDSTSYVNVYLQSKQAAKWPVPGLGIDLVLEKGERLYLHEGDGYSYKHTLEQLRNIIQKAGLRLEKYWTDEQQNAIFCRCSTDNVN